jgi:FtsH-binding integral membrane protein
MFGRITRSVLAILGIILVGAILFAIFLLGPVLALVGGIALILFIVLVAFWDTSDVKKDKDN